MPGRGEDGRGGTTSRMGAYLTPLMVLALSFGYAVGWGSFVMPGTMFLPGAGPAGTVIGFQLGAAAMAVFAFNYHRMLRFFRGPGGAYAFTTKIFGADHGFLLAWFLWLTYVAILWANATAVVLLVRCLFGDALQFGFHSPVACSSAVLRGAAGEPLRGCVNTEIRESFAAYLRTISPVLSFDVSTTATTSQSLKGWFRTESRHSRRYGATSQHGTMIEKWIHF